MSTFERPAAYGGCTSGTGRWRDDPLATWMTGSGRDCEFAAEPDSGPRGDRLG